MPNRPTNQLDALVESVRASAKYQAISEDLIRGVGQRELAARKNLKEAIKATKNKLHQVAGAFLDARPPYAAWLTELRAAANDPAALRAACAEIMQHHASTRERLPTLAAFYTEIFAQLPPVSSVLDVACGLNPLACAWMPLAPGAHYAACDLYADMIEFLNAFFPLAGVNGHAFVCDVVSSPPRQPADIALVLKALPTIDQLVKKGGRMLLRALNTRFMLVSFPAQSLGGHAKHMGTHYAQRFTALAAEEGWPIMARLEGAGEVAFLVRKQATEANE
jgi:16S rRNA (guanine(1405)-N(7))-methyltransferase